MKHLNLNIKRIVRNIRELKNILNRKKMKLIKIKYLKIILEESGKNYKEIMVEL